ncbi:DUF4388 domain-containing protein [Anabaena cylindrica FACHB-243]|uniref:PatA-like N-terminal domain-containing protein n=1 Tax=Anabaena cylindrica (strain ATCC 27899 / PCC 7122) TaxID=272123 RepID=K9ZMJ9_ANACC|nr:MULTISPECIES: DUF4388 domain-containing protein [Anabaena]AFZ59550.1 hypothetical protein Anacy_4184 [Anabaena cylindrica PCC 7122]MBD2418784.1 DUF4388 domain-containing protein [Anabaena cylindrica FACHB-243]MBY5284770.1 DUF4388 domain-containing protein [Anabaena sp. CCAP 1446/1C]MBY5310163.1 DUF4388 domain-containing protein [Anabaena sp. CCAP 1446/1C]MCM2406349.1 DUF4388 domain-containing protein [Anabaena sp. CCAP 1446/1C]
MTITGNFADFSLPELLQFLDQGKKTGLLYIEFLPDADKSKKQVYYIWLHQGRVVSAADRLDQQGLTLMIAQRGWISERVISRVTQISSCFINSPLGLCLKSQGLVQPEQLKLLFNSQVLRPVCSLFQVKDALFKFEPTSSLPLGEMTGLSMSATEVILIGLRALRDWTALEEKLPDPTSGLSGLMVKQPKMQLNAQEWQVWEFVNGQVSLQHIANQLTIPIKTVQQIAFRLIVVGLAEEYFMVAATPTFTLEEPLSAATPVVTFPEPVQEFVPATKSIEKPAEKSSVSQSFLKNLVGFLRSKTS